MSERVQVDRLLERFGIPIPQGSGVEVWAPCPVHADKSPSWSINRTTGQHHCFSCGWGGSAAALALHMLGGVELAWTLPDAWRWLGDHGYLDDTTPLAVDLYLMGGRPTPFVLPPEVRLDVPPEEWPTPARRYMRSRRVPRWQVRRWRIGFAVDGRLAGRIVFPIRDARGAACGYSARTFTNDAKRYLTPRAEEHPNSRVLFGEEHWTARDHIVVTEGAFDALAAERVCRVAVAGLSGVTHAADPLVIGKLASFGLVSVLTDPDEAGERAWEVLRDALVRHVRGVRRVRLPGGDDAASTAPEVLREALAW